LAEELGLEAERIQALLLLGKLEGSWGNARESAHLSLQALELASRVGWRNLVGQAHTALGRLMCPSNPPLAREHFQQSLAIARQMGDRAEEARMLGSLAETARREGQWDEAIELAREAVRLHQEGRNRSSEAIDRACLGLALFARGAQEEGREHVRAALHVALQLEHWREALQRLKDVAIVHECPGEWAVAAACYLTGLGVHQSWGFGSRKWQRRLERAREAAERAGEDWAATEQQARERPLELVALGTGIAAERWEELLPRIKQAAQPAESA
jgi:tetratricopeptide (TPR) repeat protein